MHRIILMKDIKQNLRKQKDIIMFLNEKNFYYKMSIPQRKKS